MPAMLGIMAIIATLGVMQQRKKSHHPRIGSSTGSQCKTMVHHAYPVGRTMNALRVQPKGRTKSVHQSRRDHASIDLC